MRRTIGLAILFFGTALAGKEVPARWQITIQHTPSSGGVTWADSWSDVVRYVKKYPDADKIIIVHCKQPCGWLGPDQK